MRDTLTKQEWLVMEAFWDHHPMYLSELRERLQAKVHWSNSTFLTYLRRLEKEGYLRHEVVRGSHLYEPIVRRDECMVNESRSLMSRMTASSKRLFLTNMIKEGDLEETDKRELRTLIDNLLEEAKLEEKEDERQ